MIRGFPKSQNKMSGIYIIESCVDARFYIGSAVSFIKRFNNHSKDLRNRTHHNSKLQNFYNKYGSCSLEFRVLEICDSNDLLIREQYYIDQLSPYFNICKIAGSTLGKPCQTETRKRISESNSGKPKRFLSEDRDRARREITERNHSEEMRTATSNRNSKKISQYDLSGNFIRNYKSATEASRDTGISLQDIRSCCLGKLRRAGMYQWRDFEDGGSVGIVLKSTDEYCKHGHPWLGNTGFTKSGFRVCLECRRISNSGKG